MKDLTEPQNQFLVEVRAVPENQNEVCVEQSRTVDKTELVVAPEGLKVNVLSATLINMSFNIPTEPYGSIRSNIAQVTSVSSYLRDNSSWHDFKKEHLLESHGLLILSL
ncbi:uncharacterized protein [Anabrus simplex]|uniref:uncharacterized protein n=1 Tax=Anabrus simplex TaxID=316456 RepID=UPI0035A2E58C